MQLGVFGLGTMGANLARNAARNGAIVPVFNRTTEKTDEFMKKYGKEGNFIACHTLQEFINALKPPRPILLMVKAGKPVDEVIDELLPLLAKGDILIDAGNSHYRDTARREAMLKEKGIHFVGMGVSGGEEGALKGPSMMPGGDKEALDSLMPLLQKMSAGDGDTGTCVSYMGPDGAGHFVKMVHNGIEYGIMQLIAESYDMLKSVGRLSNADLATLFDEWNKGEDLQSFLVEITARVFRQKDPDTGKDLIDLIADRAGQKGTGKWTTEAAMDIGVAIPTITAAVDARILSGDANLRKAGQMTLKGDVSSASADARDVAAQARSALELATIVTYLEGFHLLEKASKEYGWGLNLPEVARIWRGGCIIRSVLLPKFQEFLSMDAKGVMRSDLLARLTGKRQQNWRQFLSLAVSQGIPMPAHAASLVYFDTLRREHLPQNLIQGQRDLFGAHTYERMDKPGVFHTEWNA